MPSCATNHRQLSSLLLQPENSTSEYEHNPNDNNIAYFSSLVDGGTTTLTILLQSSTNSCSDENFNTANNNLNNCTALSSSVSLNYGHRDQEGAVLVRTPLRNKDKDTKEEIKWVCCSEVHARSAGEEVTSCIDADDDQMKFQRLSLKLDYQDILKAWSDRSPLCIHAESSQIVPDISHDDDFLRQTSDVARVWRVPEMTANDSKGGIRSKEEVEGGEVWKLGQREASILRYKEKRHNRLFARRIRYQVRKINAEKRPRIKGRFVKRS